VTFCQWQKRLDPSYDTYGSGAGAYNYVNRLAVSDVGEQMTSFATTGAIQRPLITVAGTMDALLPINHHARAYARKVADAAKAQRTNDHGADDARTAYRLYEVQNGNHIENYKQRNFSLAKQRFESALAIDPSDGPSRVYLHRTEEYLHQPPPPIGAVSIFSNRNREDPRGTNTCGTDHDVHDCDGTPRRFRLR